MAKLTQRALLAGLLDEAEEQVAQVRSEFEPLCLDDLLWHPSAKDWNILQCIDHLNETHAYYARRIQGAQQQPRNATGGDAPYSPSFFGRIYMNFAFNPRLSFPARGEIAPGTDLTVAVLERWQAHQAALMTWLQDAAQTDLTATRIPIERRVSFNLGDCLRILVHHNALHIDQAQRVLMQSRGASTD